MLDNTLKKLWNWYTGLPWYWKLPAVVVLLFLVVLFILSFFVPKNKADKQHDATVNVALETYEDSNAKLDETIKLKKRSISKKLNLSRDIDAQTIIDRKRILDATTMEDLDALQKEFNL